MKNPFRPTLTDPLPGFLVLLTSLWLLVGCATSPSPHPEEAEELDAPEQFLAEMGIGDARFQRIEGFEHIMVDPPLRWRMEDYRDHSGMLEKKAFIRRFLKDANGINNRFMENALTKAPADSLPRLLELFLKEHPELAAIAADKDITQRLTAIYLKHSEGELDETLTRLQDLKSDLAVDSFWQGIVDSTEESIKTKGRVGRLVATAPLVPFIFGWIWYHAETDDRHAHTPDFDQVEVYSPEKKSKAKNPGPLRDPWSLLEYFAPTVIQQVQPSPPYPSQDDRFGEVFLEGGENPTPGIHTDRPTLYAYHDKKVIQGIPVVQLVYTLWYPEHPPLKKFDPEAGPMEGWTFRITLNQKNQPLVYESVSNCGCYYKVFPTDALESWSSREFPQLVEGKRFHLERNIPGRIDAVVPELVPGQVKGEVGPVTLYYSSGHHQLVTVRLGEPPRIKQAHFTTRPYRLAPYEELENLPLAGRKASLFDTDGLVRKAHRPECDLLTPSGLYHAGHPRQRGTQMIYFDQADFEDPDLLDTYLRLPGKAFTRDLP